MLSKIIKFISKVFDIITEVLSYPAISISLIVVVAFIILITILKKKNVKYSALDITGIILNIILSVGYTVLSCFSLPFAFLFVMFSQSESKAEQLLYALPIFMIAVIPIVCIASLVHSASLRSNGFKKKSFLIQFAPIGWVGIIIILSCILSAISQIFI